MVDASAPIYPDLRNNNGGSKVRLKEINRIRTRLENDITVRRKLSKRYKKLYTALHGISVGSTSIAAALSGITIGMMTNPGVILPLTVTNLSLGAVGVMTGVWSKSLTKRAEKHEKLFLLAASTLNIINEILSTSLMNSHIDDSEFKMVTSVYQDYLMNCKRQKDRFAKNDLVERDVILKDIKAAIGK